MRSINLGGELAFFNDLRALTRYMYFESQARLLAFMYEQLELGPHQRVSRNL